MDGIFPALLQWGQDYIIDILMMIFKASIVLGYIPTKWREIRVIFIPKAGKNDYSTAKSFRPISLTSFVLKTLERLVERHIKDTPLLSKPLHPNQHGYISGRSTESALHNVVGRIERSLDNEMSTLGVFIDIEGAFDKTTLNSIHSALTRHRAHNFPMGSKYAVKSSSKYYRRRGHNKATS